MRRLLNPQAAKVNEHETYRSFSVVREERPCMDVYLIGVGMGDESTLTIGAKRAIDASDVLIGAKRLLAPFSNCACEKLELVRTDDIVAALHASSAQQASVLLSGDVGFYSGATALYDRLDDYNVHVIPGISSPVYLCAKLHIPWQDAALVSAHGRDDNAVGVIQSNTKTVCLTGGKIKAHDICAQLVERGLGDVRIAVGERLSYEDERIIEGTAAELAEFAFADLSVMLALNPHPVQRAFSAPSLPDNAFERGAAPMTKEEVRALAVSKLRIADDHVIWDVGAGTGSVSVELALAAPRGLVYAIEKKQEALELLTQNREAQKAFNMSIVEGEAPLALESLPAPDRVFIGGSSGSIAGIIDAAVSANPNVRICATAVTLETLSDLLACLRNRDVHDADIVQVSVARAATAGSYHLMRAENPVYIVTVDFGERALS